MKRIVIKNFLKYEISTNHFDKTRDMIIEGPDDMVAFEDVLKELE